MDGQDRPDTCVPPSAVESFTTWPGRRMVPICWEEPLITSYGVRMVVWSSVSTRARAVPLHGVWRGRRIVNDGLLETKADLSRSSRTLARKFATLHEPDSVNTLAWSPDSRILAGPKTLWLADGTLIKELVGQPQNVNVVSWSPNGEILASGGSDGMIRLWTTAGESAGTLSGSTGEILGIAWSPDGKKLSSSSTDNKDLVVDNQIDNLVMFRIKGDLWLKI